jgi:hypothetical protein
MFQFFSSKAHFANAATTVVTLLKTGAYTALAAGALVGCGLQDTTPSAVVQAPLPSFVQVIQSQNRMSKAQDGTVVVNVQGLSDADADAAKAAVQGLNELVAEGVVTVTDALDVKPTDPQLALANNRNSGPHWHWWGVAYQNSSSVANDTAWLLDKGASATALARYFPALGTGATIANSLLKFGAWRIRECNKNQRGIHMNYLWGAIWWWCSSQ